MNFVEEKAKNHKVPTNNFLVQYLIKKTRASERGSKARHSLGNLYALFVLAEDYVADKASRVTDLLARMQALPFGRKLQNHPLDNRLNAEFARQFRVDGNLLPIKPTLIDGQKSRIISEDLLKHGGANPKVVAQFVLDVVETYIALIAENLKKVLAEIKAIETLEQLSGFFNKAFAPKSDARLFEIVSYVILKEYYHGQIFLIGPSLNALEQRPLALFRTGRTNANDGGIDFVLQPLGKFFQVTETLNFKKYFLDFSKVNHYKISFVIKTEMNNAYVKKYIFKSAVRSKLWNEKQVCFYMSLFEEIFTLEDLRYIVDRFSVESLDRMKDQLSLQFQLEYGLLD